MTALQAVGTSLGGVGEGAALQRSLGSLAATAVLGALVCYVAGRLGRARAGESDERVGESDASAGLRPSLHVSLPAAYLVALVAMVAGGYVTVLRDVSEAFPAGWTAVGSTFTMAAGLTLPAIAAVGAYLGAVAGLDPGRLRGRSVGVPARGVLGGVAVVFAALTFLVVALSAAHPETSSGFGAVGTTAVLGGCLLAGWPWIVRARRTTREPTQPERERLARLCADVDFEPSTLRVLETSDRLTPTAYLRGVPGRRHLFVPEPFLSELDDDRLRARLALAVGRARLLHSETKAAAVLGPLVAAVAFATGRVPIPGVGGPVAAAAVLVAGVVGLWLGQRLVYRADADAARRTSCDAVARAIRSAADLADGPQTRGPVAALRRMEPPLSRRIERLRDRVADN